MAEAFAKAHHGDGQLDTGSTSTDLWVTRSTQPGAW